MYKTIRRVRICLKLYITAACTFSDLDKNTELQMLVHKD